MWIDVWFCWRRGEGKNSSWKISWGIGKEKEGGRKEKSLRGSWTWENQKSWRISWKTQENLGKRIDTQEIWAYCHQITIQVELTNRSFLHHSTFLQRWEKNRKIEGNKSRSQQIIFFKILPYWRNQPLKFPKKIPILDQLPIIRIHSFRFNWPTIMGHIFAGTSRYQLGCYWVERSRTSW